MITMKLEHHWTYRTPEKTVHYPAGEHEVFKYIAEAAEADGVIPEGTADGEAHSTTTPRKARAADIGESGRSADDAGAGD